MKIQQQITDDAVLGELGRRLAHVRLDLNITQAELAEQAGVSKRTVERLESGGATQLASFVRVCRALGMVEGLDLVLPETSVSPIMQIKTQGRQRQRASGLPAAGRAQVAGSGPGGVGDAGKSGWTWGDDPGQRR